MGCEIHGGAEWAWTDSTAVQSWEFIGKVPDVRNYQIFSILASVRQDEDKPLRSMVDVIPLRGLPHKMSEELQYELNVSNHSCTWYTLTELNECRRLFFQVEYTPVADLWLTYIRYLTLWSRNLYDCDVRIVIGFDN